MSNEEHPVEVPYTDVDAETLRRVVAEFVSREGTDYGVHNEHAAQRVSTDAKIEQVLAQLKAGTAALVVDTENDSINIVPREHLRR